MQSFSKNNNLKLYGSCQTCHALTRSAMQAQPSPSHRQTPGGAAHRCGWPTATPRRPCSGLRNRAEQADSSQPLSFSFSLGGAFLRAYTWRPPCKAATERSGLELCLHLIPRHWPAARAANSTHARLSESTHGKSQLEKPWRDGERDAMDQSQRTHCKEWLQHFINSSTKNLTPASRARFMPTTGPTGVLAITSHSFGGEDT